MKPIIYRKHKYYELCWAYIARIEMRVDSQFRHHSHTACVVQNCPHGHHHSWLSSKRSFHSHNKHDQHLTWSPPLWAFYHRTNSYILFFVILFDVKNNKPTNKHSSQMPIPISVHVCGYAQSALLLRIQHNVQKHKLYQLNGLLFLLIHFGSALPSCSLLYLSFGERLFRIGRNTMADYICGYFVNIYVMIFRSQFISA